MSIADIPTNFGVASFMRNFLPGFLFSIIVSYTFFPTIPLISTIFIETDAAQKLVFWIVSGFVLGIFISSKDFSIYKILSGTKCTPRRLFSFLNDRELRKYNNNKSNLMNCYMEKRGELKDDYSIFLLNEKIGDLSGKLRKYPFNEEEKYNYPITWTRLGNVLAEYEGYSEVCYGMHFNVFWQRLWYILSKDEREDIEQRGATADFLSYMALLILIYAPFSGIGWYLQLQNYKSPLGLFDSIYFIWILSFIGFLLVHRSIYNAAVDEHERYGGYIKALFDIHHSELLAILPNPTQMDIKKCLEYSENFEDYSQLKI